MKKELKDIIVGALGGIIVCTILSLLIGCKTITKTEYVDRYTTVHDTIHQTIVKHDSIALRDSVFLFQYIKGDTVYKYKYVERSGQKDRIVHDSIYLHKTDTVFVDKQVCQTAKKNVTFWQWLKIMIGTIGFLFIIYVLIKLKKGMA